jgi:hypothetical protein
VKGRTITSLFRVPKYNTLKLKGLIQKQCMTTLVDGGATHNFIYASLVAWRGLRTDKFEGFTMGVEDGYTMTCLDMVPDLEVKLEKYTLTYTFYVVDLSDTVQCWGYNGYIHWERLGSNY